MNTNTANNTNKMNTFFPQVKTNFKRSLIETPNQTTKNFGVKCSRKKTSNTISIAKELKNKNFSIYSYESQAYNALAKKYNCSPIKFNIFCINYLINNVPCRLVSKFKETMIIGYIDEFLKRKYSFKECKERIPKFYLYYKHYSIFFGVPFFVNNSFNVMIQKNGEKKARIYYKNHYQNGESWMRGMKI